MKFGTLFGFILLLAFSGFGQTSEPEDTTLVYPIPPIYDPTQWDERSFDLGDPSSVNREVYYDPVLGRYVFRETIGNMDLNYRKPSMMTLEEYIEYERQKAMRENWKERIDEQSEEERVPELPITIPSKQFENFFGSDQITIQPRGNVQVSFGVNSSRYDNPILPVRQRRITRFDFQQNIKLDLTGQIGTKLKVGTSYNTQASFDFDNISKIEFGGNEDQILQKIELGQVRFQPPSALISGSSTLFGAYSRLKFGNTDVELIAAASRGRRQEINISGKAQVQEFQLEGDSYEANRHYFVNLYHHDHYDEAMATLPYVNSTVNITRIEVWVTNRSNIIENTRNIIAFSDLGEAKQVNCQGDPGGYSGSEMPDNESNNLYNWASNQPLVRGFSNSVTALSSQVTAPGPFEQAVHYEKVQNARKLTEQEFSYNALLGFISLNLPLNNDEVLGVAYEYTYEGETYQVGEFSTDGVAGQDALILKLLKPTITNPKNKVWDLMMKNVYSIGAYQVDQSGFKIDVLYNSATQSIPVPYMELEGVTGTQLVTLVGMDRLNQNQQAFSDGVFDFVPIQFNGNRSETGGTINTRNGRIYFSSIEPFGKTLADKLLAANIPPTVVDQIAFRELYDSTQTAARQIPAKNRFSFKGEYQSSISSDIPLNALNVPEGAVTVTAGGQRLVEGVDFTVDYNLGRVKILNSGVLEANVPIKISIESNSVFGFQSTSLFGTRVSHKFSDEFRMGATWMRMMERPVTQKVDYGSEPYKNNVVGLDFAWNTEIPWLTKAIDFLPIISTKEKSTLSFTGEVAHLIPGEPRAIGKGGTSYVDDFEGAQSTIDMKSFNSWKLASIPQGQPDLFPEAANLDLSAGYKRAKLAWYMIDPLFNQSSSNLIPQHIAEDPEMRADSRMRLVQFKEVFPQSTLPPNALTNLPTLDLAYYPNERGMYNYDTTNTVNPDGTFTDPENRWSGIMRSMTTTDFELANVEYIQFWLLDPFNQDAENSDSTSLMSGGDLYFNLGNISEDILPDSRKSFENGLPPDGSTLDPNLDITEWAKVSTQQVVVNAFDTDPNSRSNQDVGFDGYKSSEEVTTYTSYINWINNNATLDANAKLRMKADPSGDDYTYYLDDDYDLDKYDILTRYKKYNGVEGNSPTTEMSDTANSAGYPTQATNTPDVEDINLDNNLSQSESYFQYKVSLRPQDMVVGKNYITNIQEFDKDGNGTIEKWYQFKVPIKQYERKVNGIQDFRSIRFMRMFMKEFEHPTILRFARLELIRGEWRRYLDDLTEPGEYLPGDADLTTFNIGAVNVFENDQKSPVPYAVPPGIQQEIDPTNSYLRELNEQSLVLSVCDLADGDARAAYKNAQFNIRTYKKMKMFVHAEEVVGQPLNDNDLTVFVRLGTDFVDNYYEYELPLKLTPHNVSNEDKDIIWPEENNIEIVFADLLDLKKDRNDLVNQGVMTFHQIFEMVDPKNSTRMLRVKGNPNLQAVKTIMVGIRNPAQENNTMWVPDDGLKKCVEVWINELRLTDFVSEGGSAATSQVKIQGADFGNLNMSANYSGINWGSVQSRVQDRQRNEQIGFDLNSTVQLGQFFGRKARVNLPFFYSYSLGIVNPEYDPFNPDVQLRDYDLATRKDRAKLGQDFNERRAYNFNGVRKELKAGAENKFWRISNWTASYAYSEHLKRDFNTVSDLTKTWTSNVGYNYSFNSKPVMPFNKVKFMKKSKWWSIIRDMNFYLAPKNISFSNDIYRLYNERVIRNNIVPNYLFDPIFLKRFEWDRDYSLGYDVTRKLKFTFKASNHSVFEEGNHGVDRRTNPEGYQEFRDTIRNQIGTFGKAMNYNHSYSINYSLPLEKIPVLDWMSATFKYTGTYDWTRAPFDQEEFGNTIQNSRNINMSAQANFVSLYNKVPYLKKVLNDGRTTRGRATDRSKTSADGPGGKKPGADVEEDEEEIPDSELTPKERRKKKREKRKKEREKRKKKRLEKDLNPVVGFGARLIMSVRSVSGTYSLTDGTMLPGYNQSVSALGYNPSFGGPLTGFLFGKQTYDVWGRESGYNIADISRDNNWLVQNENINRQFSNTHSSNLNIRASLEPMKDLSIELTLNRTYSDNFGEFYRWNSTTNQFESQSRVEKSTVTYSNVSLNSAFALLGANYASPVFQQLMDNRVQVSTILGENHDFSDQSVSSGFYDGYSGTQQEVVIGAFMTSYTNRSVNERNINPIKNLPLPNWSINYDGLKKFKFMKEHVRNFVLRHSYSSTVTVSGMQTNLNAEFDASGNALTRDLNNNYLAEMQVQNIVVSERFSPLVGLDATWEIPSKGKKQGLITKFEFTKDRSATLSLNNNQVTEVLGTAWVIGTGYKFSEVKLPFGKIKPSDLSVRADVTFRDNLTVIRKIAEETNQATAGQKVVSIKATADYDLNKFLTIQFYYDHTLNTPKIQTSFPTGSLRTGISLKYNLAGVN